MIIKVGMSVAELIEHLSDEDDEACVKDIGMHGKHVVDIVFGEEDEDEDEDEEDEDDEDD